MPQTYEVRMHVGYSTEGIALRSLDAQRLRPGLECAVVECIWHLQGRRRIFSLVKGHARYCEAPLYCTYLSTCTAEQCSTVGLPRVGLSFFPSFSPLLSLYFLPHTCSHFLFRPRKRRTYRVGKTSEAKGREVVLEVWPFSTALPQTFLVLGGSFPSSKVASGSR